MANIKMLSRAKAADLLGVCNKTIDNMIRRKEIKAVKFGRRVLIPEHHLAKSLDNFQWEVTE
tara:strand:+ start:110 stop:295 length:186 start_codon:yes stop_codon:yes gene_type:complete